MAMGDIKFALRWLDRASFSSRDSPYESMCNLIACKIASVVTESSHCLSSSQQVPGSNNLVPDLLSFNVQTRDSKRNLLAYDNPPDDILTNRPHLSLPQFIPKTFRILP
jgi:hypothetical protein